ncbi:expressed unknown protein [Seminavis robusta]|uniref:Uncharacterized protein n=1 Tax=Seminavis robusta TaxID=568900 RepID=A0A9N8EWC6_9STRA|nr:expressed unknown protein [Seminavis robusta]|eukprot:Sro1799_g298350.1 n/a (175) ;mRNA; f:5777-6301
MCSSMTEGGSNSNTSTASNDHGTRHSSSQKQVRFQEEKLEELFELELVSDQDKKAKWMTRGEFKAIHADICQAVEDTCFSRHYKEDDDDKCFRGLEAIISSCRRVQIQSFIQDLLEIQEDYKQLGLLGPAGLQNYSENNSRDAKEKARLIAEVDATEARRVYAELFASQQQDRQ